MLSTIPGRSALTVTPWTATTDPIALSDEDQCSTCATVVVTASGGGCQEAPCAIAALIWKNFTVPMQAMTATSAASVMIIRFLMRRLLYRVVPVTSIPRSSIRDPVARASSVRAVW